MAPRPLSPNTQQMYDAVMTRAFGDARAIPRAIPSHLLSWTDSNKALLRAAVRRRHVDERVAPETAEKLLEALPGTWSARRVTEIPAEEEALAYEAACRSLPPGRHAMALLPLALGLRATEVVTLSKLAVSRAAKYGELLVMRKGSKEQLLPAAHAKGLFEELLDVKAARLVSLSVSPLVNTGKAWKVSGEVISTGDDEAAYHALHRLVRDTGTRAGLEGLHPHALRHAFATRMSRDGAPIALISWTLGHSDIKTTLRYIHPDARDAAKFVRPF